MRIPLKSGRSRTLLRQTALAGLATAALAPMARAESPAMIRQPINDLQTVGLPGNTRPEAVRANDRGPVADNIVLEHMQILLGRPEQTEKELVGFIDKLQDRTSPLYHQWLTPADFETRFGTAQRDVDQVTRWLESHGFTVHGARMGRMIIDFTGSAAQVREAFHTEIHNLDIGGVHHIANMSNPRIPAALAGVVRGIVSLHDFRPHTNFKRRPDYTVSTSSQLVVPADLATIYNFNPLFSAGISGQGQTIVVIEDTNVYSTTDWTTFRSTFGLSGYTSGSFTQVHPAPGTGGTNCANPGVNSADGEAILDAEWASAGAPSAAIELASCKDTSTTFGGLIALQNLLSSSTPPSIVSISYGECEAANGAAANATYNTAYQMAVTLGTSVFVSAGDEGAASCDANLTNATHGIGVSGFASTPYNVAVGGTDFGDSYAGTNSTYWSSTNSSVYGSAKSYIPEIPWADSCANVLLSTKEGYSTPYGSTGFCNSRAGRSYLTTGGGSGGPSGCATGNPSISEVVSGTCAGYAKPSWQSLVGVPSDGVRDIPDVSLFAANGVWGHYYVFCYSDPTRGYGGAACTGAPSGWSGAGGTSFASPILASIQALVNQKTGAKQGNPNPTYYALAKTEYGASGSTTCNSTTGAATPASSMT